MLLGSLGLVVGLAFAAEPQAALAEYRVELAACRQAHGGAYDLPDVKFFLFGMGPRTKLLYRGGRLTEALTGREVARWDVRTECIVPCQYGVWLETADGRRIVIREDGEAVWLEDEGRRTALPGTSAAVRLPGFAGHRYPRVLRVLHQELLVNIVPAGPVPNLFVYPKPWYRDGAMAALALSQTGNVGLLRDWIMQLCDPYDRNNAGVTEPDNLGQVLVLIALVSDRQHPLVRKVMAEAARFEVRDAGGRYLRGRSDFAEHPIYQTKWMKFGLAKLGLPDPYTLPDLADSYSALFWMDYRDRHRAGRDSDDRGNYPYLGWACDHFHGTKRSPLSNRDYPLTWEAKASQARYEGMRAIDPVYVERKLAAPHTWHAAEAFLLLATEMANTPAAPATTR